MLRNPLKNQRGCSKEPVNDAGMRLLWSPKLMFVGLFLLTVGCTLRVSGECSRTRVMYGSFRFHS